MTKTTRSKKQTIEIKKTSKPKKPSYKVTNAYIEATITCLEEFDNDRVNKSLPAMKEIGFDFDPSREPYCYHDSNETDCTYYYVYDTSRKETYQKIYDNIYKFYEKHHADFHWFNFTIETDGGTHESAWYVFRYKNLGIMRSIKDVEKYKSYGDKKEAKTLKLNGKKRVVSMKDKFV